MNQVFQETYRAGNVGTKSFPKRKKTQYYYEKLSSQLMEPDPITLDLPVHCSATLPLNRAETCQSQTC